jgi:hypothetical protein
MSRFLAISILAALVAIVGLAGIALAGRIASSTAAIEEGRTLLGRLEASLAALGTDAEPDAADGARPLFVEGPGEQIALASLQSHISSLAESSGLRLQSATGLPLEEEGALRSIGLHIEITGSTGKILELLTGLEATEPVLIVQSMHLSAGDAGQPGELLASFDVRAALAPQAGG